MLDLHLLNGRRLRIPHLLVANDRWLKADQRVPAINFPLNLLDSSTFDQRRLDA